MQQFKACNGNRTAHQNEYAALDGLRDYGEQSSEFRTQTVKDDKAGSDLYDEAAGDSGICDQSGILAVACNADGTEQGSDHIAQADGSDAFIDVRNAIRDAANGGRCSEIAQHFDDRSDDGDQQSQYGAFDESPSVNRCSERKEFGQCEPRSDGDFVPVYVFQKRRDAQADDQDGKQDGSSGQDAF